MKFSKVFAATVLFFLLLFIPTNIYATANDAVTFEHRDSRRFDPLLADVSASRKKVYLKVGTQSQLNVGGNTTEILSWQSSKKRVISVNKKTGKIRGLRGGSSLITAKMKSGYTAEYLVIVYERLVNIPEPNPNTPFIVSYS